MAAEIAAIVYRVYEVLSRATQPGNYPAEYKQLLAAATCPDPAARRLGTVLDFFVY